MIFSAFLLRFGESPTESPLLHTQQELARFLAENGANLGKGADEFDNTPLHACCINGHKEVRNG